MAVLNPKRMTERLLSTTYVREAFEEMPACDIFFALAKKYAPDILIELYWPELFRNPEATSKFPGVPLGVALEDVARFCGVTMTLSDYGAIQLSVPKRTEDMKHAVVLEPDPKAWQKVEPKNGH